MSPWDVVGNENGTFDAILNGETIKSGFSTEDEAWKWIDSQDDD